MQDQAARQHKDPTGRLATVVMATSIAVVAGAKEHQPLNSDKIRERFGHYGVELLHQDATTRLASLYSLDGDQRITRTLALTRFELPIPDALANPDAEIRAGASIGATLRDAGWQVSKSARVDCYSLAGQRFGELGGESLAPDQPVLIRVYTLQVKDAEMSADYATIAEAYHPQHISVDSALPCIDAAYESMTDSQVTALKELLSTMGQGD